MYTGDDDYEPLNKYLKDERGKQTQQTLLLSMMDKVPISRGLEEDVNKIKKGIKKVLASGRKRRSSNEIQVPESKESNRQSQRFNSLETPDREL